MEMVFTSEFLTFTFQCSPLLSTVHRMQLAILLRGLSLLASGGRLVYSTCSLNPIENEAVVAAALREHNQKCKDDSQKIDLVDTKERKEFAELNELKRTPGLTTWKVCPLKNLGSLRNKKKKRDEFESGKQENGEKGSTTAGDEDDKVDEDQPEDEAEAGDSSSSSSSSLPFVESWAALKEEFPSEAHKVAGSMWPQGDEEQLGIERCMRIYPHLQNTGGFFVAVLEKRKLKQESDDAAQEEVGMAAGIKRGIEALDAKAAAQTSVEAGAPVVGIKREREASQDDQDDASKKPKLEAEAEADTPAAPAKRAKSEKYSIDKSIDPATFKEDPYVYCPPDNPNIVALKKAYQLPDEFLRNLMARNITGDYHERTAFPERKA